MESFSNICSKRSTNIMSSPNVISTSSTTCYEGVNYQGIPSQDKRGGQRFHKKTEKPKRDDCHFCSEHRSRRKCGERIIYRRPEKFIIKRKRRIIFTTQQILALEKIFNKKPHVNKQEREFLTERLNVSERVIKLWFRNRRRLSGYSLKTALNCISDSSEEDEISYNLDYVQSRINEPDEFGYVTLDDRAMKELVTVIDSILTDVILTEGDIKLRNETSIKLLNYEPVSPVSFHDNVDENLCYQKWEIYEPEESLRRLFDVQALITK